MRNNLSRRKLSKKQIKAIKAFRKKGSTIDHLVGAFGVSRMTIYRALKGRSYGV